MRPHVSEIQRSDADCPSCVTSLVLQQSNASAFRFCTGCASLWQCWAWVSAVLRWQNHSDVDMTTQTIFGAGLCCKPTAEEGPANIATHLERDSRICSALAVGATCNAAPCT